MTLDLSSLEKAINSLEAALQEYNKNPNDFIRDSCIQRFEYSYELSHKMIRRFLKLSSANPAAIAEMSFSELIRTAQEKGLISSNWSEWKKYRQARNQTSHGYNENMANQVFAEVQNFITEAQYLLKTLKDKNNG